MCSLKGFYSIDDLKDFNMEPLVALLSLQDHYYMIIIIIVIITITITLFLLINIAFLFDFFFINTYFWKFCIMESVL